MSQIQEMVELSGRAMPVIAASSQTGKGVPELAVALAALPARPPAEKEKFRLLEQLQAEVSRRFANLEHSGELTKVMAAANSDAERVQLLIEKLAER
jgi:hypothetical protein